MKTVRGIIYDKIGLTSLKMNQTDLITPKSSGILCKWLAVTINPSDLNQIEGTYPVKPSEFPAYGGNEGIAEVVEIIQNKSHLPTIQLQIGDWVVPHRSCLGTWRNFGWYNENDLLKVEKGLISLELAACLTVNPTTAWRLLKDFYNPQVNESKGWIIQNASTSMVGQCIIQLCKHWGIPNIAVVRRRESSTIDAELKEQLLQLGATVVVMEDEMREAVTQQPILAFNAVGGSNATEMLQVLAPGSTMVTYGAMSRKPFVVPAKMQIFQDLKLCGFWMTRWYKEHSDAERVEMIKKLCELMKNGQLKLKIKRVPFEPESALMEGKELLREKHLMYPS